MAWSWVTTYGTVVKVSLLGAAVTGVEAVGFWVRAAVQGGGAAAD